MDYTTFVNTLLVPNQHRISCTKSDTF